MVQFDERAFFRQGLEVGGVHLGPGPTKRISIDVGDGMFMLEDQRIQLQLAPGGLFFSPVGDNNTIEIDGFNGDIRLLNADCAEDFDLAEDQRVDPGTVVVVNDEGALQPCETAYDKRVVGVVSGAGGYKPGLVLDRSRFDRPRATVALMGKVFCKVDTCFGPIQVGDLLTPSSVKGHAMKAADSSHHLGSIIGKALRPLHEGQGLIPILVALQ
jgi:hypothetical protein